MNKHRVSMVGKLMVTIWVKSVVWGVYGQPGGWRGTEMESVVRTDIWVSGCVVGH